MDSRATIRMDTNSIYVYIARERQIDRYMYYMYR